MSGDSVVPAVPSGLLISHYIARTVQYAKYRNTIIYTGVEYGAERPRSLRDSHG
jgi:hypothetical protein